MVKLRATKPCKLFCHIREIKSHVYTKWQTWICTTSPSFPLSCHLLFNYFYSKISSFMPVLSIRIVLHSFYLLIFYSEKFLTWIWSLLFVVNVTLNLSIAAKQFEMGCCAFYHLFCNKLGCCRLNHSLITL